MKMFGGIVVAAGFAISCSAAGGTGENDEPSAQAAEAAADSVSTAAPAPSLLSIAKAWDGALLEYSCGQTHTGYDCAEPSAAQCLVATSSRAPSVIAPSNGAATSWLIGGTKGKAYNVTVHVRGVVEVTSFVGGTRAAGNTSVNVTPRNLFQTGGAAQTAQGPSFDYDPYELDVTPAGGTPSVYFLNSVVNAQNPHAPASPTAHLTFDIDYTATIRVLGGSTVSLKRTDANCVLVQNCGPTAGGTCQAPRTVDLAGANPAPSGFVQPFQGQSGSGRTYGQWLQFDVTAVTVAP